MAVNDFQELLPGLVVILGLVVLLLTIYCMFLSRRHAGLLQEHQSLALRYSNQETSHVAEQQHAAEKLALLADAKQQLSETFKNLASDIFDAKQKSFREQNQLQLNGLLKPLGEKLKDFENKVEKTYHEESRERFSLVHEIKNLQSLNTKISEDAINLTNALKGENKSQGNWGEVILERVLEKSGLVKGREYDVQVNLQSDLGQRFQPDVIVRLPNNRHIVIDSKVSLTAYERFYSAEDEAQQKLALKQHLASIKQHVKSLSQKEYQLLDGINSLDFVLLFVPLEAAFAAAANADSQLFSDAFDKNIILVAPSTLLATLRTIQNIWRYEHQTQNAQEIADQAGRLFDKFVGFVTDLDELGGKLESSKLVYDRAYNKLVSGRGNLVSRAEALKQLGANTSKNLPVKGVDHN